jgi:filamentous hemagglutinin family protein
LFMSQPSFRNPREKALLVFIPLWLIAAGGTGRANPQGLTVVSGTAHSVQQGNSLQITTSQNALLQWNSFNIAPGQTTVFREPSTTAIVFNNINDANPTTIYGSLQANGIVVLENQSGFYFGPNAFVKAGGLVVTTAAIDPWSSSGGSGWSFDGPPTTAPIVNYGCLQSASGGSLFLIGKQIDNHGTIAAPGGTAALVAGQEVLLSERPNGLSLSAPVQLPAGSVDNEGHIVANAGQVLLQAQTVNNSGVIQADSVRQRNGVIELYASEDIQLAGSSVIQANGGPDGSSPGGKIAIKSGGTFSDSAGSQVTANGGANGGSGGSMEISAPNMLSLNSSIAASASPGWQAGQLLLDPGSITLNTSGTGSAGNGTVGYGSGPSSLSLNVNTAFAGFSQITLQSAGAITLSSGTTWNLSSSTGVTTGQLTLQAGGSITLLNNSFIEDANNWSVTLEAGYNFANGGGFISGVGSAANDVTLLGSAAIKTAAGSIDVVAGNNISVANGGIVTGIAGSSVMTGTGGNINVQAVSGSVSVTSTAGGYAFSATGDGYSVSPKLSGISTASGGNVTIEAEGNITTDLPSGSVPNIPNGGSVVADFGTGAFGANPGNVTLTAGGNITGHYVVANGTGTITAGGDAGTITANLALSLIDGGWVVNATDDIYLQEVRNPNGMFNYSSRNDPNALVFNYSPLASVTLNAGDGVNITGGVIIENDGTLSNPSVPRADPIEGLIFPPILTINAGSGGITLDDTVNLFPSPEGTLNLTTTQGGNLQAYPGSGAIMNISASTATAATGGAAFTFADGNQNPLLHLNDPNPVQINISGSIEDFTLYAPKQVDMYAAGNITDCSAYIQNEHPTDITTISAGGQIIEQNNFVVDQLQLGQVPNLNALAQVVSSTTLLPNGEIVPNPNYDANLGAIQSNFHYDAATGTLVFVGQMTVAQENALLAIGFLDKTDLDYIQQQSQNEAGTGQTIEITGPGTLRISAASLSLGNEGGIISGGFGTYPELASATPRGADIDISVTGNLSMVASSIESQYGGNINITAGGSIDVGSPVLGSIVTQEESGGAVFGIVSIWDGNISVIANGNIDVDSSRIATYDGGNIYVKSLTGAVDAGSGGAGQVLVVKPYLTANGDLGYFNDYIPGSGILATSFPQLLAGEPGQIGNITVLAPEGDINASHGGIVQIELSPVPNNDATINLEAGSKNSDGSVAYVGNVNASGSGVIGGQVNISATGSINGLVVASLGANVVALQNISATVLSQGGATVSAGGTVSGTIVGLGSVTVSASSDVAAAFSTGAISASGSVSGAAVAAAPTGSSSAAAAATTQQVSQSTQSNSALASNGGEDDELRKKKKSTPIEYIGRVTVLLPN